MKITIQTNKNLRKKADFLILSFSYTSKKTKPLFKGDSFKSIIKEPINTKDFLGKAKDISLVYSSKNKEKRVLLLGLGSEKELNEYNLCEAYASAISFLKNKKASSVNIIIPNIDMEKDVLVKGVVEAIYLANYNFDKYKFVTKKNLFSIKEVCLIGLEKRDNHLVKKASIISQGVNLTRDLVNTNADDETPQTLAKLAKDFEKISNKVKVEVFDKKRIEKENMNLLLAVNKGSNKDPVFIIVKYKGDPSSKDSSVIIGKGITYDTGGLSLKPSTSMDTMKSDMSGGASILGSIYAIIKLNLKVNVTAIVPATENAIGPKSYKPGDVYVSACNRSVEVKNTDAEGRLILAEALSYASHKIKPNRVIDLASLTGACVVALGEEISALFSNDRTLAKQLIKASNKTGDHLWRLPLFPEYKKLLKSEIADISNVGGRGAGTITAALFLQEFVDKVSWAHIDIAGPAFKSTLSALHPTYATGAGVRLLVNFFENLK
ncbi:MAG: Cytosol aminopeptidase [Candidatus Anoxychlamydiales bacterium]|nr:Cytosol aminopeptidase [Candidatus Anoxychlamydiales bacterium]